MQHLSFLNNIDKEKFRILLEQSAIIRIKNSSYFYCFIHLFTYTTEMPKKRHRYRSFGNSEDYKISGIC